MGTENEGGLDSSEQGILAGFEAALGAGDDAADSPDDGNDTSSAQAAAEPDEEPSAKADDAADDRADDAQDEDGDDEKAEAKAEKDEGSEDDESKDDAERGIETIEDLAKAFELEEDQFLEHIQVSAGDGQEPVSLKKVIESYRKAPEVARAAEEILKARQGLDQELQQVREGQEFELRRLRGLTQRLVSTIKEENEQIDWEALKAEDEHLYLVKREEFRQRREAAEQALREIEAQDRKSAEEAQQARAEKIRSELKSLFEKMPDWANDTGWASARNDLRSYLHTEGFDDSEIASIVDHRSLIVAWKAAQYDRLQKGNVLKLKREREPQRVIRPGVRRPAEAKGEKKIRDLHRELVRSGGDNKVATRLFEEIL